MDPELFKMTPEQAARVLQEVRRELDAGEAQARRLVASLERSDRVHRVGEGIVRERETVSAAG